MKLNRPIIAIPLAHAALCAGCEAIFTMDEWDRCPACDDGHFLPLESIVGSVRVETKTPDAGTPGTKGEQDE